MNENPKTDSSIDMGMKSQKDSLNGVNSIDYDTKTDGGNFQNTLKMWKQESFRLHGDSRCPSNNQCNDENYDKNVTYEKAKNLSKRNEEMNGTQEITNNSVLKKVDKSELEKVLRGTLSRKGLGTRTSNPYSLAKKVEPTERDEYSNEDKRINEGLQHVSLIETDDVLDLYKRDENSECTKTDVHSATTESKNTDIDYDNPWGDGFQKLESSVQAKSKKERVDDYENPWGDDFRFGKIQKEAELASQLMVYKEIGDLHQLNQQVESTSKQSNAKATSKSFKLKKIKEHILSSSTDMIEKLKGQRNKTKLQSNTCTSSFAKESIVEKQEEKIDELSKVLTRSPNSPKHEYDEKVSSNVEDEMSEVDDNSFSNSSDCSACINEPFGEAEGDIKDLHVHEERELLGSMQQYDAPWNDDFEKGNFCEIVEKSPECEEYEQVEINQSSVHTSVKKDNNFKSLKQRRASRIERVKDQIVETSALMVGRLRSVRKSVSLPLQAGGSCFAFVKRRHRSEEYRRQIEELEMKQKKCSRVEQSQREEYEEYVFEPSNQKENGS